MIHAKLLMLNAMAGMDHLNTELYQTVKTLTKVGYTERLMNSDLFNHTGSGTTILEPRSFADLLDIHKEVLLQEREMARTEKTLIQLV